MRAPWRPRLAPPHASAREPHSGLPDALRAASGVSGRTPPRAAAPHNAPAGMVAWRAGRQLVINVDDNPILRLELKRSQKDSAAGPSHDRYENTPMCL